MLNLDQIKLPLIAILRGIKPAEAPAIAEVLLQAGIEVVEVTMNSPEPLETLRILIDTCSEKMLVGAGTVTKPDQVDQVADLGGGLIVSPNFNQSVVRRTKERGLVSAPGCLTPTEIFAALDTGADVVKIYPGTVATPAVIKSYKPVFPPETRFVVTGGTNVENIAAYKKVGVYAIGLGGNLYRAGKSAADVAVDLDKFISAYKSA